MIEIIAPIAFWAIAGLLFCRSWAKHIDPAR